MEHKPTQRMFTFVTEKRNPLRGPCPHQCTYCYAKTYADKYRMKKYREGEEYSIDKAVIKQPIPEGSMVFIQDMSDLWARPVPTSCILQVLEWVAENPKTQFLTLTKNPQRFLELHQSVDMKYPDNLILGATVESDLDYPGLGKAPPQYTRLGWMRTLATDDISNKRFISVEPILKFNPLFWKALKLVEPWAVAVGYDNYKHRLQEPSLQDTHDLINKLKEFTTVYLKTIRKAWWET